MAQVRRFLKIAGLRRVVACLERSASSTTGGRGSILRAEDVGAELGVQASAASSSAASSSAAAPGAGLAPRPAAAMPIIGTPIHTHAGFEEDACVLALHCCVIETVAKLSSRLRRNSIDARGIPTLIVQVRWRRACVCACVPPPGG